MAQQDAHIHYDWLDYKDGTFETYRAGPKVVRRPHCSLLF